LSAATMVLTDMRVAPTGGRSGGYSE
jgi:hypothetical protein